MIEVPPHSLVLDLWSLPREVSDGAVVITAGVESMFLAVNFACGLCAERVVPCCFVAYRRGIEERMKSAA